MPAVADYKQMNFAGEKIPSLLSLNNGVRSFVINGRNPDIDIVGVPEDLVPQGGVYAFLAAAVALEILSSSAADAAAGTGARTVLVSGLDANYDEISETVTLNGVTAVILVLPFLRVNRIVVVTAGSGLTNAGTLTLRVSVAGATVSTVEIGFSLSHQGIFTVPAKHDFVVGAMLAGSNDGAGPSSLYIQSRSNLVANSPFITRLVLSMWGFQTLPAEFSSGIRFEEKTDIRLRVVSVTTDNTILNLTLGGLLLRVAE